MVQVAMDIADQVAVRLTPAKLAERQHLPTIDTDGNINFDKKLTPTIDQKVAAIIEKVAADTVADWNLTVTWQAIS